MGIIWGLFRPPIRVLKAQQGDGRHRDLNSHSLYSNSRWIFLYKFYTNPSFYFSFRLILVQFMTSSKTTGSMEPWEFFLAFFFLVFFLEGKQNICRKFIVLKQSNILIVKWLDLSSPPMSFIIIARWVNHEGEAIIIYKVYGCYFL